LRVNVRFGGGDKVRLNAANTTAHAAPRAKVVDRGQEFTDPSTGGSRDERKLWRPCAESKSTTQAIERRLRTRSVRFVYGNDVGDLEDPRLHRLHLVTTLGSFNNKEHIGEPRNADLGLPGTNGLDEDQIEPCCLNQNRGRSGNVGERSTAATCGNRARKSTFIVGMLINAHAITKERAATLMRARINRQDGDATTASTCHIGEGCSE
jgi:hypothetical protein